MNFTDLYKKIAQLDEQVEVVKNLEEGTNECGGSMPSADQPLMGEEGMEECGMASISNQPPKQSDSVTMNVSMNGSGAGGIRDLMAILRNIEAGSDHDHDADKLFSAEKEVNFGEEFANEPNTVTLDIDAVTPTGDDLHSHGGNEVEKVNGGGNPYTNVDESLVSKLQAMYEAVKEKEPEGLHSKKRFETDSQRVARLAKEKRQAEKKERMRNDFNAEMERE